MELDSTVLFYELVTFIVMSLVHWTARTNSANPIQTMDLLFVAAKTPRDTVENLRGIRNNQE